MFTDCLTWCHSVHKFVCLDITLGVVRNCFGTHNCTGSALIKRMRFTHDLSSALVVELIIVQAGALLRTLDICPVLSALIISNCWLCLPAFLRECVLLLPKGCSLSIVWVPTSLFSEFACLFFFRCTGGLFSMCLLTLLVISSKVHSSAYLHLRYSTSKCDPGCFLPALPVRWLLVVVLVLHSSIVIPLLYIAPALTTNPLQLLLVPYLLVKPDAEVTFWRQLCIWGFSRLGQDLFRDCNMGMWLIDSSVGAFAITSLHPGLAASLLFR